MNLVINSTFRPFTYDEMVKPLVQYKEVYDKLEQDYSDLAAQTEMWKDIANREKSPLAYEMYQRYSNDLAAITDSFSKGMNISNRRALMGMKKRYAQDITPIATAYQRQQTLADEQRKTMAANPTMRYERYANDMSLDDFINDPSIDYGRSYSGALLTKQVSDAAANFKKQISEAGNLTKMGLPFQYQQMIRQGFSPDAVFKAMADDAQAGNDQAVKYLRGIVDNVMTASGVANWADDETLREFRNFANQGLYSAIGETELKHYTDAYSMQEAHEINREARAAARAAQEAAAAEQQRQVKMYRNNSSTLYSQNEVTTQNKELMKDVENWKKKGYLTSDGKLSVSGLQALQDAAEYNAREKDKTLVDSPYWKANKGRGRDFLKWASQHGLTSSVTFGSELDAQGRASRTYIPNIQFSNLNTNVQEMMSRVQSGELASGIANVQVGRVRLKNKTTSDNLVDLMTSAGGNIIEVGSLDASGKLKAGKAMSPEDFAKLVKGKDGNGARIVHLVNSPTGNQQFVELSNGRRFFIPSSVFGESVVNPRTGTGDLDLINAALVKEGGQPTDRAIMMFANSQAYLSSLLDASAGSDIDYMGSIVTEDLDY